MNLTRCRAVNQTVYGWTPFIGRRRRETPLPPSPLSHAVSDCTSMSARAIRESHSINRTRTQTEFSHSRTARARYGRWTSTTVIASHIAYVCGRFQYSTTSDGSERTTKTMFEPYVHSHHCEALAGWLFGCDSQMHTSICICICIYICVHQSNIKYIIINLTFKTIL